MESTNSRQVAFMVNRKSVESTNHQTVGQDSFLYQKGNQDQRRKGEINEKKRLIG